MHKATNPGQDIYAKHSRHVPWDEEHHAADRPDVDVKDLRRLQRPRELDPLELETRLEEIAREVGITVSEIKSRSREARAVHARHRFIVAVGNRAPAKRVAEAIGRQRQWVEQVLASSD